MTDDALVAATLGGDRHRTAGCVVSDRMDQNGQVVRQSLTATVDGRPEPHRNWS